MDKRIHILYTGQQLDQNILDAAPGHYVIDVLPFIETRLNEDNAAIKALKDLSHSKALVVLTSRRSVEWVVRHVSQVPDWTIACMEGATQSLLQEINWGNLIQYTGNNALELAKKIAADHRINDIYFIGSDRRLAHLPDFLKAQQFNLHELVAYQTLPKKQLMEKDYDGIVFLSPSAVESFFEQHTISPETTLFSMGASSNMAIQRYTGNSIVVSPAVHQSALFETIYHHYNTTCQ